MSDKKDVGKLSAIRSMKKEEESSLQIWKSFINDLLEFNKERNKEINKKEEEDFRKRTEKLAKKL